jgi:hypothetical protein
MSSPPVSFERARSEQPHSHAPPPQEQQPPEIKSAPKGVWFALLGLALVAVLIVVFILLRHH